MVLLEELDVTLRVGTDRLREPDRDGMKEVEVDRRVPLEFSQMTGSLPHLTLTKSAMHLLPSSLVISRG